MLKPLRNEFECTRRQLLVRISGVVIAGPLSALCRGAFGYQEPSRWRPCQPGSDLAQVRKRRTLYSTRREQFDQPLPVCDFGAQLRYIDRHTVFPDRERHATQRYGKEPLSGVDSGSVVGQLGSCFLNVSPQTLRNSPDLLPRPPCFEEVLDRASGTD